jgi:hypothetical protein
VANFGKVMFSTTLRWFHGAVLVSIITAQLLAKGGCGAVQSSASRPDQKKMTA